MYSTGWSVGRVYIRHMGVTVSYKATDLSYIYSALVNMGCDAEDAEDIVSWVGTSTIGDEYETGDPTLEIRVGV